MQCEDQEYQETFAAANATSGASSQAQKVKKMVVPRSTVWDHFTRNKENRNKCVCHHCQKTFSCASKSGTSNLKQHLQICKEHIAWLTSQKKNQQQIGNGGNLKASKLTEAVFKEACNELVVLAELPLSFIESTAFKHFCDKVLPFKPHSRRTLTRNIVEMFVKKKAALKNLLITTKDGLSDLSENVLAIRNAVQYVRSSTTRLHAFDQRVTNGKMTRGSLPLDVKTRWNSTFLMLSRALQFKVAFDRMEAEDRLYNDYFLEVDNGAKRNPIKNR
ncbi:hypothetical protein N665_0378s0003 [Sinapis alba]|nr:hypothetical protein N665_0378s0003 [Sinapis alba]